MKEFFQKIKEEITLEKIVVRLVMAWLITALFFFLKSKVTVFNAEFAASVNVAMFVSFVILFFVFFCVLGHLRLFSWMEIYGPMLLVTIYGTVTIMKNSDLTYLVGVTIVLAVTVVYAVNKTKIFAEITKKSTVICIYILAALVYMGIAGSITVLRYVTYRSPAFDFGIWAQMFYNMKESFEPVTTIERERLLSHFAVHFSPIYYIYLPVYFIFSSPVTLQVLQVITLASGIIPVYLLCRHFGLSKSATACFGVIFALFPSLACGCYYDLHENCFLVPLILWLFYFAEKEKLRGMIIFSVLICLVKEDAPVYVACIGLFYIIGKKQYRNGSVITLLGLGYFCIVTALMSKYGLGIMSNRYDNFMAAGTAGSLMDVIRNFVVNPAYALSECFSSEKMTYLLYMLLPTGFLSVAFKNSAKLILLLPMILVNLASDYVYQHSIFFQYTFGVLAILFYLAISNYAEMSDKTRRSMCAIAICASIMLMPLGSLSRTHYYGAYKNEKEKIEILNQVMESIPKDASVSASTFFTPHLADREELYEYPYLYDKSIITDYVIIDLRFGSLSDDERSNLESKGYRLSEMQEGLYAIFIQNTN